MSNDETIRQHVADIAEIFKSEMSKGAEPDEIAISNAIVANVCALLAQALVDLHAIAEASRASQHLPSQIVIHGS